MAGVPNISLKMAESRTETGIINVRSNKVVRTYYGRRNNLSINYFGVIVRCRLHEISVRRWIGRAETLELTQLPSAL
jgi:hypothetical protein